MPLMTNLYTGVSGLTSSQNAINITSHNLANVYTEGYVRQQAQFSDRNYSTYGQSKVNTMQIGYGVDSTSTQHYRDILLDKAFRQETGRGKYYSTQYEAIEEVETIMGELNGEAFQTSMSELWSALSEVAKTPDSTVARASLIMNAETFISRAKEIYGDLTNYQDRLDQKVTSTVDRINELGDQIHDLSLKIQSIEGPGVESANDFRDQRDVLLDELAGLVDITYEETEFGNMTVRAEGQEFITTGGVFHMAVSQINGQDGSTYSTPVWPNLGNAKVFNLEVEISTAKGNDVGALKGYVQARGGFNATYEDIPHIGSSPTEKEYTDADGVVDTEAFAAAVDKYWNEDYPAYEEAVKVYNTTVGNSPIMKTEAMFDQLINGIVTMVNDALCPNTQATIAAGTTLTIPEGAVYQQLSDELKQALKDAGVDESGFNSNGLAESSFTFTLTNDMTVTTLDMKETSFGSDDAATPGTELFSRTDTLGRYTVATDGDGNSIYLYNPYNQFGEEALYSVKNVEVNETVANDYSLLPFTTDQGKVDLALGQELLDKWDAVYTNLDPSNMTPKDFNDYYDSMTGILANDGYVYQAISENQTVAANSLNASRVSFTGVSSNDELTNLIRFQNAYNANSRYINVVSEMLNTLITKVGNW
jgi:flagellar hook-associated protein 1 FlgK